MAKQGVRRWVVSLLWENFGLKLFALLVAIGLYGLVRGAEDATTNVPVNVVPLLPAPASNKMLVSELPDEVQLTLHGSRSQINQIVRDGLDPVQIDLRDAHGSYYTFDPGSFDLPAGVDVVQIAPRSVPLTWATRGRRRLPIKAEVVGTPMEGTRVRGVRVGPDQVTVIGPEYEIETMEEVRTEPIEITGLRAGTHERPVPLQRSRRNVTFGSEAPVSVSIEIVNALDERTLSRVEIAVVGTAARVQVRPQHVNIVLRGLPATMAALDAEQVVPFVAVGEIDPAAGATPVRVDLRGVPEGVDVVSVEPPEVLVTVPTRRAPTP